MFSLFIKRHVDVQESVVLSIRKDILVKKYAHNITRYSYQNIYNHVVMSSPYHNTPKARVYRLLMMFGDVGN